jgi:hypothetical protein
VLQILQRKDPRDKQTTNQSSINPERCGCLEKGGKTMPVDEADQRFSSNNATKLHNGIIMFIVNLAAPKNQNICLD